MNTKHIPPVILLCTLFLLLWPDGIGMAAGATNESVIQSGTGLDPTFDAQLKNIALGFIQVARLVALVMTAVAGAMVAWGVEDGKKTTWNIILGVGLAMNFASFFMGDNGFLSTVTETTQTAQNNGFHQYVPNLKTGKDGPTDILSSFMDNYLTGIITPGAANILPYCIRLLVILTVADVSFHLSIQLISGDKIKYLLSVVLKAGFYMFLMINWIPLMTALSHAFQQLGYMAGGVNLVNPDAVSDALKPDSIVNNAIKIFSAFWDKAHFTSLGLIAINIISLVVLVICMFLTAIEMFMARIEFYTMALITMPLLAFGSTKAFKFLSEKAIGAMINLALKVSVIAFISTIANPFMETFAQEVAKTESPWEQIGVLLQAVLAALVIYFLTKKIPDLVSSLLNGQPSLGGNSMLGTAIGTAQTAKQRMDQAGRAVGSAVGTVQSASAMAHGRESAAGKDINAWGHAKNTLGQMGRMAYQRNPVATGYRNSIRGQADVMDRNSTTDKVLDDIQKAQAKRDNQERLKRTQRIIEEKNPFK